MNFVKVHLEEQYYKDTFINLMKFYFLGTTTYRMQMNLKYIS